MSTASAWARTISSLAGAGGWIATGSTGGAATAGVCVSRMASAIEFVLEGLHLSNRLNKRVGERGTLYART